MDAYVAVCVTGGGDDEPGVRFVLDTASGRLDRAVAKAGWVAAVARLVPCRG